MLTLGYDIGSSSIKCAIMDCESGQTVAHGSHPAEEMEIQSPQPGWAEQDPELWWEYVVTLTQRLIRGKTIDPTTIKSIGISYQMHGLVLVDEHHRVLRPSIIWCDSRAVGIGNEAFAALGSDFCLRNLLNSPGNFTASKLRWVRENEPDIYTRMHKAMLPGDFIAMKLTGEISTTVSGLSEGMFWDFKKNSLSSELLYQYAIDETVLPGVHPTFSIQGCLTASAANQLGLSEGTPVAYRAGDQPNNAFSLNVLNPGDIAATAGTSGVVYGVSGNVTYDPMSRVNPFAHVNHSATQPRLGVLLCINGTGIQNSWLRKNVTGGLSYADMNAAAAQAPVGSGGLTILPFGNGAERMLQNKNIGAHTHGLDFNRHSRAHLLRAAQEGIAFSFKYGMDIMRDMGLELRTLRAGHANMFLSPIFTQTLADVSDVTIELFATDGAQGAARGAAVGAKLFTSFEDAFKSLAKKEEISPSEASRRATQDAYDVWLKHLQRHLTSHNAIAVTQ